jgi:nucleotide-binding universal stress UspA family protein
MTTRFRHILHASDFSPASRPAFALAVGLARSQRAALTVVHVMAPAVPVIGDAYVSPQTWTDLQRQVRAYAQRELDQLLGRARRAGVRAQGLLVEGAPADRIVRAARSRRADLIVMGTHGRGGLARLFLGSVAERVVATAPCPVLTVRGR